MLHLLVRPETFRTALQETEGASVVEYAVVIALITTVISGAVAILGGKVNHIFSVTVMVFSSAMRP